jgi:type II secretory pathway component GspD/PulD (secretin)
VQTTRYSAVVALIAAVLSPMPIRGQQTPSAAPLRPVPITQLDLKQPHPELDRRRVSLRPSRPTPIKDILPGLVRGTRLSVTADPSITQTFVGELKNLTIREALDVILEPSGLEYSIRGDVIRVFPREPETRFFHIDYVSTQRTSSRSTSHVTGTDSPDVYAELTAGVKSLLSAEGRLNVDRTAALLRVTDRPSRLARIEQYLDAVMLRVTRQVQIEAKVIEVDLRDEFSAGVDWRSVLDGLAPTSTQAPTAVGGSTLTLNVTDFGALLKALSTQGIVNVLASPRIIATNNEPTIMRAATQDTRSVTDSIVLSLTAQISADGLIHMNVNPSVTERTGLATLPVGDQTTLVTVREADTVVRVRQGETVVIAGLIRERPDRRKSDLVILLTPTVVNPAGSR